MCFLNVDRNDCVVVLLNKKDEQIAETPWSSNMSAQFNGLSWKKAKSVRQWKVIHKPSGQTLFCQDCDLAESPKHQPSFLGEKVDSYEVHVNISVLHEMKKLLNVVGV